MLNGEEKKFVVEVSSEFLDDLINSFNSHLQRIKNELMKKSFFDFEKFCQLLSVINYSTNTIILKNVSKMENISEDFLRKMADFEEDTFKKYKADLGNSNVNLKRFFLYLIQSGFNDALLLFTQLIFLNLNLKKGFEEKIFSKKYEVDIFKILPFVGTNNMNFLENFRIDYTKGNIEEMLNSIEKNKNDEEGCPFVLYDLKKIINFLKNIEKDLKQILELFLDFLKPYEEDEVKNLARICYKKRSIIVHLLAFYTQFQDAEIDVNFVYENNFINEVK